MKKYTLTLLLLLVLTACTQTNRYPMGTDEANPPPVINFANWYIRGVFNWWEAKPAFKLNALGDRWYVDVELIAERHNSTYDFKFSDLHWTTSQTCGASGKSQQLEENTLIALTCGKADNLQFTPKSTGVYRFTVSTAAISSYNSK